VCALYPDLMNIYADRGNLLLLERRCAWRGIGFELSGAGLGEPLDPDAHDLFYLGGGQDRDQALCAQDLATVKRDALHAAAGRGAVLFGVCGGYQLLGHGYALGAERLPGIGLVDLETVREAGPRLIGNVAIAMGSDRLAMGSDRLAMGSDPFTGAVGPPSAVEGSDPISERSDPIGVLAGFENHGGRTRLGAGAQPLGRVLAGHGNDGRSGYEGVRGGAHGTVVGTYLHGPLLPKNAWFADWLTATALGIAPHELAPLDDALEDAAHAAARRAAGIRPA
jgi:lipid II isoglutaminyl synthase (glutamine-hydrolysing)